MSGEAMAGSLLAAAVHSARFSWSLPAERPSAPSPYYTSFDSHSSIVPLDLSQGSSVSSSDDWKYSLREEWLEFPRSESASSSQPPSPSDVATRISNDLAFPSSTSRSTAPGPYPHMDLHAHQPLESEESKGDQEREKGTLAAPFAVALAQARTEGSQPNVLFATDFDVTCTLEDSSETLMRLAANQAVKWGPAAALEIRGRWDNVLDRYADRLQALINDILPSDHPKVEKNTPPTQVNLTSTAVRKVQSVPSDLGSMLRAPSRPFDIDPGTISNGPLCPFNPHGLRKALERLGELENLTNGEVIKSGVLRGATGEEIAAAAGAEVRMRPDCGRVLRRVAEELGVPVHAVSANWSEDLVRGAVQRAMQVTGNQKEGSLQVHSNNLSFGPDGRADGGMIRRVQTALDKERVMEHLREEAGSRFQGKRPFTVYLGDGVTDLLALLSADLGIVVGQSSALRRVAAAYGLRLRPLASASEEYKAATSEGSAWSMRQTGVLYETSSWKEVEVCLFGNSAKAEHSSASTTESDTESLAHVHSVAASLASLDTSYAPSTAPSSPCSFIFPPVMKAAGSPKEVGPGLPKSPEAPEMRKEGLGRQGSEGGLAALLGRDFGLQRDRKPGNPFYA